MDWAVVAGLVAAALAGLWVFFFGRKTPAARDLPLAPDLKPHVEASKEADKRAADEIKEVTKASTTSEKLAILANSRRRRKDGR